MQLQSTASVIAHRGGAHHRPENSLAAFAYALAAGVDGIECDIQCSKDGQVVLYHDLRLNPSQARLAGRYITRPLPAIAALDYSDLAAYDIGRIDPASDYGKSRPAQMAIDGTSIPLFTDLCDLLHDKMPPDFQIIVEMKSAFFGAFKCDTVNAVCDLLENNTAAKALADNMVFISFDWRLLAQLKKQRPQQQCHFLTIPFDIGDPDRPLPENTEQKKIRAQSADGAAWLGGVDWRTQKGSNYKGADYSEKILRTLYEVGREINNQSTPIKWFAHWRDIDATTLALAQQLGFEVGAWTINDFALIKDFAARGVSTFITDDPILCKQALSN